MIAHIFLYLSLKAFKLIFAIFRDTEFSISTSTICSRLNNLQVTKGHVKTLHYSIDHIGFLFI